MSTRIEPAPVLRMCSCLTGRQELLPEVEAFTQANDPFTDESDSNVLLDEAGRAKLCDFRLPGQGELTAHFGLGQATTVSRVEIRWPSGHVQTLVDAPINQVLNVRESN